MKRKLVSLVMSFFLLSAAATSAFADSSEPNVSTEIERYADGSYAIITTELTRNSQINLLAAAKTKSSRRTYAYYGSDKQKKWTFVLNGTFSYDGKTAKAVSYTTNSLLYVSGWKCAEKNTKKSGSTIKSSFTFKYNNNATVRGSVGLKCSKTGVISKI